ncbi:MAG: helix-hairpin-helix domain-containing protein [Deltaproteobacteria bacterium]|nr:helix-hairpin-helix domain-containing protein [Deltaproteobacteria bacterium]
MTFQDNIDKEKQLAQGFLKTMIKIQLKEIVMGKIKRSLIFVLAVLLFACFSQPVVAGEGKININTASKKELITLEGVGKKTADRIIEYRKEKPFEKKEELMNVKGIGKKKFDKNKDLITVKDE